MCEKNCFCQCDGGCMRVVKVYNKDWQLKAFDGFGIVAINPNYPPELNGKQIRPLFPDNVPDFTQQG